jgi:AraC-like DNA-binding protein
VTRLLPADDKVFDILRRTRTILHESEHGTWELARCTPAPGLSPYLVEYQGYRESAGKPVRRREMPSGNVVLIINFGADWLIGDAAAPDRLDRFSSFTGGVSDRYAISESTGAAYCMQVNFTPIGAARYFRSSGRELSSRVFGLSDVAASAGDRLVERLHDAPDWPHRFALLEAELIARLGPDLPETLPAFVWSRIVSTAGAVGISELAAECGVSRKHLTTSFRDTIGLAPKPFARICRFQRSAQIMSRPATPAWSALALDCGYYDQSHFNRDFRYFSGYTPSEFRLRVLTDGTGVIDA